LTEWHGPAGLIRKVALGRLPESQAAAPELADCSEAATWRLDLGRV